MRHRVGMQPGRNQPGEVGHVDPQEGADLVGDGAERGKVESPRVRRPAGADDLRPGIEGDLAHRVHVDAEVFLAHAVEDVLVELAREVQPHAVREVTTVGEVETEQRLPRLHQRHQHCGVGLRPRMRLHVGEFGAEQLFGPVARNVLDDVDVLAPAVVAASRIALGIFVSQHTALRLEHRARHKILRRDHLQGVALPGKLAVHRRGDIGIELRQGHRIHRRCLIRLSHTGEFSGTTPPAAAPGSAARRGAGRIAPAGRHRHRATPRVVGTPRRRC